MRSLFLFSLLILAACASISNEEVNFRKVSIDDAKDLTIENQFVSDELSTVHLKAFEKRAIEKLRDFADYVDIISDQSYEEEFRKLAMSQAKGLFIEHSEIKLMDGFNSRRIELFLDEVKERSINTKVLISDIAIETQLKESIGSLFEGTLTFGFSVLSTEHQEVNHLQKRKMEFFLMKTPKSFGTNQKMVWEIFLGDIY
jgi:hypothetical protein